LINPQSGVREGWKKESGEHSAMKFKIGKEFEENVRVYQ
jgi:hypothetical protein